MSSIFANALIALFVLTGAAASGAEANRVPSGSSDANESPSAMIKLASADAVQFLPQTHGSAITLASVSYPAPYAFVNASHQRDLSSKGAGLEMNESMLVGMGVFLIFAIWQRRTSSITD